MSAYQLAGKELQSLKLNEIKQDGGQYRPNFRGPIVVPAHRKRLVRLVLRSLALTLCH